MPSAGLAPRRIAQLSALLAMFALFTAQIVSALLPNIPVFVAASAAGLALDTFLQYRDPGLLAPLGKVRFDALVRQLLRDMLILVGLLPHRRHRPLREQAPLVVGLLAFYALHFACQALSVLVRRTRTLPMVTRNIDASALRLIPGPARPAAPPRPPPADLRPADHGRPAGDSRHRRPALGGLAVGAVPRARADGPVRPASWLLPSRRPASEQAGHRAGSTRGWPSTSRPSACTSPAAPPRRTRRTCGWRPLAAAGGPSADRAARALHGAEDRRDRRAGRLPARRCPP